jgi:phosphoglycolate phosphatase
MPEAVFFDLDGTLADTAPDLGAALNRLLLEEGRTTLPHAVLRPHVSAGARGLLRVGFGIGPEDAAYALLRERFLDMYAQALCEHTTLFDGMDTLLAALEARSIAWGVVTNKPERFTLPLMEALGLAGRAAAIVGGDTTAKAKPDPLPLLHACTVAGVAATASAYVGDDLRDIQAGRAAGMRTFAAAWGYLGDGPPIGAWEADHMITEPGALLEDIALGGW